jgi:D-3-phosphoglycerate dehydrogenase / 2-oxoglutarate reductase
MSQSVILVTHKQLSEDAKKVMADAGARAIYLSPPITEDMLIETITREGVGGVLMRLSPPFTRRVLEATPTLKIIAKHGAGIDSVDLDAATERGIAVVNAGGANADPVAEYSVAVMLSLARDVPRLDRDLRGGKWEKGTYMGREFRGRKLGIIGYGQIGRRVAAMAAALGAQVIAYSRTRKDAIEGITWETDLDRLLSTVDILSLHCPLTDKTRGLIGRRELALMKPTAILINTSRGPVVDEAALTEALSTGKLAAAGLDVFAEEPTDPKNPLLQLPNVIVTPHVSAMTEEAMTRMGTSAATQILNLLKDGTVERENLANPEVANRL